MKSRALTADAFLSTLIAAQLVAVALLVYLGHKAMTDAHADAQVLVHFDWWAGACAAGSAGFSLLLRHQIRQAAQRPIKLATLVVERIATGDLTVSAEGMDQVHTRRLMKGLQSMTSVLHVIVSQVVQGARAVATHSRQLAQDNRDLARRTEEEACALQETASSLEELTSTVAHNAESARQASAFAAQAKDVANAGGGLIQRVVQTMGGISESATRISEITATIDAIAFQTNILSLNAAVEAARAGEEGRGFAVVASEVRELAHRSAIAAKEIKALIVDSVHRVEEGARLVNSAGETMGEIVSSVAKVSVLVADIAQASVEQTDGLTQVNTAVAQMERVAQQNAALVDRATNATDAMDTQADALLKLVSQFRVDGDPDTLGDDATSQDAARPADTAAALALGF